MAKHKTENIVVDVHRQEGLNSAAINNLENVEESVHLSGFSLHHISLKKQGGQICYN